ncbi:hypothetical protein MNBD_GAMMA16-1355 [hydrothermal vent metagenome]|uniref:GH29D-like beta-sandwich domain-containing protein n=1 Tax=hydrothermal vent metagenome TaxID=652676 RepID=A0A3B0ZEV9_9ZZZZ
MLHTNTYQKKSLFAVFALVILTLCLFSLSTASLAVTLPEKRIWVTDGTVNAIVTAQTSIYIGGDFNYVGPNTGPGVSLNTSNPQPSIRDPIISGGSPKSSVFAVLPDGDGGWYVGGNFTIVGTDPENQSRNNLVHILSTKAVNPAFNPAPNGIVRALSLSEDGNTLYVGGEFTTIGGQNRNRIAAITVADGSITSWNPDIDDNAVFNLLLDDAGSRIFVGGSFGSVNGDSNIKGIASLNTNNNTRTASWLVNASVNANDIVYDMELNSDRNRLYIGGSFTNIGTQARNNIAALDPNTGTANAFNPDADGTVHSLMLNEDEDESVDETQLYVGGSFLNIGGELQNYAARLSTGSDTNNLDSDWAPAINNTVRSIVVSRNRIYIGGDFTRVESTDRRALIALTVSGNQAGWFANANGEVHTIAFSTNGTNVFVGGEYLSIGGQERNKLARIDSSTGAALSWVPVIDGGNIQTMALNSAETTLYLGGTFTSINTTSQQYIAKLQTATPEPDLYSWNPNINGPVDTLALLDKGVPIVDIAIDPNQPETVYVASELGIYKSTDGATSWNEINNGLSTLFVKDLAIDPGQSSILYAATRGGGVFKSTDSGASWVAINSGLTQLNVNSVAITPDGSTVYVGTEGVDRNSGLFRSKDGGANWLLRGIADVTRIAIDPNKSNLLYMGTTNGLFRIEDGGEFAVSTNIISRLVNKSILDIQIDPTLVADDTPSLIYIVNDDAIFSSSDNGTTWALHNTGLPIGIISRIELDKANTSTLYAGTTSRGVFKSTDSAKSWARENSIINNRSIFSLAIHPSNSVDIYAGSASTLLFKSTDGADTWEERHDNIPNDILFAGGSFSAATTHPDYLAAIDTADNINDYFMGWDAMLSSNSVVNDLLVANDGNRLFVGGSFTNIGGQARNNIATIATGDGMALDDGAPSIDDGVVNALAFSSDEAVLYAGGSFTAISTNAGSFTRSRLAAFNTAGGSLLDWNPEANNDVYDLVVSNLDNLVYASGIFTNIGGASRNHVASLRTTVNTNNATDWTPNPDAAITGRQTLASRGQFIYVGGGFEGISNTTSPSIAAYLFAPPTVAVDPKGRNLNASLSITLTCKDLSGTGCATIFFTTDTDLNTATWNIYTGPITIDTSTKLSFYAEDNEGTRSAAQTESYTIDRDSPTVSAAIPSGTYTITQTVPLICNDGDTSDNAVSGCASIFFTTDGSTPSFTTTFNDKKNRFEHKKNGTSIRLAKFAPILISGTLKFVAVDNSGNSSTVVRTDYNIVRGKGAAGSLSLGGFLILFFWVCLGRIIFYRKVLN